MASISAGEEARNAELGVEASEEEYEEEELEEEFDAEDEEEAEADDDEDSLLQQSDDDAAEANWDVSEPNEEIDDAEYVEESGSSDHHSQTTSDSDMEEANTRQQHATARDDDHLDPLDSDADPEESIAEGQARRLTKSLYRDRQFRDMPHVAQAMKLNETNPSTYHLLPSRSLCEVEQGRVLCDMPTFLASLGDKWSDLRDGGITNNPDQILEALDDEEESITTNFLRLQDSVGNKLALFHPPCDRKAEELDRHLDLDTVLYVCRIEDLPISDLGKLSCDMMPEPAGSHIVKESHKVRIRRHRAAGFQSIKIGHLPMLRLAVIGSAANTMYIAFPHLNNGPKKSKRQQGQTKKEPVMTKAQGIHFAENVLYPALRAALPQSAQSFPQTYAQATVRSKEGRSNKTKVNLPWAEEIPSRSFGDLLQRIAVITGSLNPEGSASDEESENMPVQDAGVAQYADAYIFLRIVDSKKLSRSEPQSFDAVFHSLTQAIPEIDWQRLKSDSSSGTGQVFLDMACEWGIRPEENTAKQSLLWSRRSLIFILGPLLGLHKPQRRLNRAAKKAKDNEESESDEEQASVTADNADVGTSTNPEEVTEAAQFESFYDAKDESLYCMTNFAAGGEGHTTPWARKQLGIAHVSAYFTTKAVHRTSTVRMGKKQHLFGPAIACRPDGPTYKATQRKREEGHLRIAGDNNRSRLELCCTSFEVAEAVGSKLPTADTAQFLVAHAAFTEVPSACVAALHLLVDRSAIKIVKSLPRGYSESCTAEDIILNRKVAEMLTIGTVIKAPITFGNEQRVAAFSGMLHTFETAGIAMPRINAETMRFIPGDRNMLGEDEEKIGELVAGFGHWQDTHEGSGAKRKKGTSSIKPLNAATGTTALKTHAVDRNRKGDKAAKPPAGTSAAQTTTGLAKRKPGRPAKPKPPVRTAEQQYIANQDVDYSKSTRTNIMPMPGLRIIHQISSEELAANLLPQLLELLHQLIPIGKDYQEYNRGFVQEQEEHRSGKDLPSDWLNQLARGKLRRPSSLDTLPTNHWMRLVHGNWLTYCPLLSGGKKDGPDAYAGTAFAKAWQQVLALNPSIQNAMHISYARTTNKKTTSKKSLYIPSEYLRTYLQLAHGQNRIHFAHTRRHLLILLLREPFAFKSTPSKPIETPPLAIYQWSATADEHQHANKINLTRYIPEEEQACMTLAKRSMELENRAPVVRALGDDVWQPEEDTSAKQQKKEKPVEVDLLNPKQPAKGKLPKPVEPIPPSSSGTRAKSKTGTTVANLSTAASEVLDPSPVKQTLPQPAPSSSQHPITHPTSEAALQLLPRTRYKPRPTSSRNKESSTQTGDFFRKDTQPVQLAPDMVSGMTQKAPTVSRKRQVAEPSRDQERSPSLEVQDIPRSKPHIQDREAPSESVSREPISKAPTSPKKRKVAELYREQERSPFPEIQTIIRSKKRMQDREAPSEAVSRETQSDSSKSLPLPSQLESHLVKLVPPAQLLSGEGEWRANPAVLTSLGAVTSDRAMTSERAEPTSDARERMPAQESDAGSGQEIATVGARFARINHRGAGRISNASRRGFRGRARARGRRR